MNAQVTFRIRRAGRDSFQLRLPAGADLVSLESSNQKSLSRTPSDLGLQIQLALIAPVVGEHTVRLAYRIPRAGPEAPVTVAPLQVFDGVNRLNDLDQYLSVLRDDRAQLKTSDTQVSGLTPIPASKLPYLPEGIEHVSLSPVFRASSLDWSVTFEVDPIRVAAETRSKIGLAMVTTTIGNDGTHRTRVVYTATESHTAISPRRTPS